MEPVGFMPSIQPFLVSFVSLNSSNFYFNCGSLGALEKLKKNRKSVVGDYLETITPLTDQRF